jgi:hypothetical protein
MTKSMKWTFVNWFRASPARGSLTATAPKKEETNMNRSVYFYVPAAWAFAVVSPARGDVSFDVQRAVASAGIDEPDCVRRVDLSLNGTFADACGAGSSFNVTVDTDTGSDGVESFDFRANAQASTSGGVRAEVTIEFTTLVVVTGDPVPYSIQLSESATSSGFFTTFPNQGVENFIAFGPSLYCHGSCLPCGNCESLGNVDALPRSGSLPAGSYLLRIQIFVGSLGDGTHTSTLNFTVRFGVTATEFHWINPAGGTYGEPSNWDPAEVPVHDPSRSDTAIFDLDPGSTIDVSASSATAGDWLVSLGTYRLLGSAEVFAPSSNPRSLEILDGGYLMLTSTTFRSVETGIGQIGAFSIMDVANPATTWENSGAISVGNGFLDVFDGGSVSTDGLDIGTVGGGAGRVRCSGVSGGTRSTVQAGGVLSVGGAGTGALDVLDGAQVQADIIGIGDPGQGAVLVKGSSNPGDPLDTTAFASLSADEVFVGGPANGTLTLEKGGQAIFKSAIVLATNSGTGRLIVDGQGALAFFAAETLTVVATELEEAEIKGGGHLETELLSLGSIAVGGRPGAADLTIRGTAPTHRSALRIRDFPSSPGPAELGLVGTFAEGLLRILEGAAATFEGGLVVGDNAQGIIALTGDSNLHPSNRTLLSVTGETRVGVGAPGIIHVRGYSTIDTNGDVKIGLGSGRPSGSVTVESAARLDVDGTLSVGAGGEGLLRVLQVSVVTCNALLVGGNTQQANGTIILQDEPTLFVSGNAQVGAGTGTGLIEIDSSPAELVVNGTLTIGGPGGGKVIVNGVIRGGGLVVVVPNGRLEGTGTVSVAKVDAGGYIAPGLSPGTLTIDGDLEMLPTGVLVMEHEGPNPGQFDVLHVTGQTTLGGRLEVHFRGDFSPDDPAAFIQSQDFVEADQGITGDYDQRIYAFPDLFADFDDDGDKDLLDVAEFQNCFGLSGPDVEPACGRADWEDNDEVNEVDVGELVSRITGPQ